MWLATRFTSQVVQVSRKESIARRKPNRSTPVTPRSPARRGPRCQRISSPGTFLRSEPGWTRSPCRRFPRVETDGAGDDVPRGRAVPQEESPMRCAICDPARGSGRCDRKGTDWFPIPGGATSCAWVCSWRVGCGATIAWMPAVATADDGASSRFGSSSSSPSARGTAAAGARGRATAVQPGRSVMAAASERRSQPGVTPQDRECSRARVFWTSKPSSRKFRPICRSASSPIPIAGQGRSTGRGPTDDRPRADDRSGEPDGNRPLEPAGAARDLPEPPTAQAVSLPTFGAPGMTAAEGGRVRHPVPDRQRHSGQPDAGILIGNGYSWTADTCPTTCDGGKAGLLGDGATAGAGQRRLGRVVRPRRQRRRRSSSRAGGEGGNGGWFLGNGGDGGNGGSVIPVPRQAEAMAATAGTREHCRCGVSAVTAAPAATAFRPLAERAAPEVPAGFCSSGTVEAPTAPTAVPMW